jgi:hypothetical protein
MNPLMLLVIALVALCYCGGKLCPSVLRQNKEMLLGVAVGMALCSFMDLRMEGLGEVGLGPNQQGVMTQIGKGTAHIDEAEYAARTAQDEAGFALMRRMCASGEVPAAACAGAGIVSDSTN